MPGDGPAPKHPSTVARRNNPKAGFRSLPSKGRTGEAPPWPLGRDVETLAALEFARDQVASLQVQLEEAEDGRTKGRIQRAMNKSEMEAARLALVIELAGDEEKALWAELWSTPQATLWEETYSHREVAQYVRWKIRGEQGDLRASVEARQLSDRLGLNPLALMRLRTEIEHADEAEDKGVQRRKSRVPAKKATAKKKSARAGLYAV